MNCITSLSPQSQCKIEGWLIKVAASVIVIFNVAPLNFLSSEASPTEFTIRRKRTLKRRRTSWKWKLTPPVSNAEVNKKPLPRSFQTGIIGVKKNAVWKKILEAVKSAAIASKLQ